MSSSLGGMKGLSRPQAGNFLGFSIELSVANQMLGTNSSRLAVPFLNHIATIKSRAGAAPPIRVGGNTQEKARLFFTNFQGYEVINKSVNMDASNPTLTPDVDINVDLFYMMMNISGLLGVEWYSGLPFKDPTNTTGIAAITATIEEIMGDRIIGLQMGNEPDLYGIGARSRPQGYSIGNFMDEWGAAIAAMQQNPGITNPQILLGPTVCCNIDGLWSIDQVIQAGYVTGFNNQLRVLAVQRYPHDNCAVDNPLPPEVLFPQYMRHDMLTGMSSSYTHASAYAMAQNKPFVMFETNTGSCGGFGGLSDSFGAAMWVPAGIDWALQLAFTNFTNALYHFGGQNVAYNPFTPAPGSVDTELWTTNALYYSYLMVAEALGPSNQSQVIDLTLNSNNVFTPGYAIYENGNPTKVVLINYLADPSGASDLTVTVAIGGGTSGQPAANPSTVSVRRLSAATISQKFNITWAGQNMGYYLESDGRLRGTQVTETVNCDPNNGCQIKVPAPGAALVFLTQDGLNAVTPPNEDTMTFPTTTQTGRFAGGATIDNQVLLTMNGRGGKAGPTGKSTSQGKNGNNSAFRRAEVAVSLVLGALGVGAMMIARVPLV
ncbi:uncharacterized protein EI90DRAFT_2917640 [Cantharellus anzutake]|uniref:uncharacterized protein n=1 Tax=Cantharellus anzutake TaxID=1750568 RepID=UPI0019063706|nr:uncharacterized protein EI90DRAFT_2917640 [Cantharellus anzutake]KAF8332661.1 hypothetical protein EI90DRAFT_2917640 [Cantharellus anzutake]